MRHVPFLAILFLAALAGGCATAPPAPESFTAPGADLAAYRSFGWKVPAEAATAEAPLRIIDTHIRTAIRAELTRRGYTEAATAPELLVDYETLTEDKLRSSPVRLGIGMGSFGGHVGGSVSMGTPDVESYQEGRLVIHVLDAAKSQEVWYGTLAERLGKKGVDAAAVARVVGQILAGFPARPGSEAAQPPATVPATAPAAK